MSSRTALTFLPVCLVVTAALAGCAGVAPAAKPPPPQTIVMAVIDDAFYVGFATPQGSTGSTLEIVSQSQGVTRCSGEYRQTSPESGTASLRCTGSIQLTFPMTVTPAGKAFGYCRATQGVASLTYGFSDRDAQPLLLVPATIPIPATDPNELTRIDNATI
jgi:hypothetical protein